jgi:hypothetical protein
MFGVLALVVVVTAIPQDHHTQTAHNLEAQAARLYFMGQILWLPMVAWVDKLQELLGS